jgi:hypothetical protein
MIEGHRRTSMRYTPTAAAGPAQSTGGRRRDGGAGRRDGGRSAGRAAGWMGGIRSVRTRLTGPTGRLRLRRLCSFAAAAGAAAGAVGGTGAGSTSSPARAHAHWRRSGTRGVVALRTCPPTLSGRQRVRALGRQAQSPSLGCGVRVWWPPHSPARQGCRAPACACACVPAAPLPTRTGRGGIVGAHVLQVQWRRQVPPPRDRIVRKALATAVAAPVLVWHARCRANLTLPRCDVSRTAATWRCCF